MTKPLTTVRNTSTIFGNALKVALFVGSLLNLINHGDTLLHGDDIEWKLVLLNYCVPFCVSAYSSARALPLSG